MKCYLDENALLIKIVNIKFVQGEWLFGTQIFDSLPRNTIAHKFVENSCMYIDTKNLQLGIKGKVFISETRHTFFVNKQPARNLAVVKLM